MCVCFSWQQGTTLYTQSFTPGPIGNSCGRTPLHYNKRMVEWKKKTCFTSLFLHVLRRNHLLNKHNRIRPPESECVLNQWENTSDCPLWERVLQPHTEVIQHILQPRRGVTVYGSAPTTCKHTHTHTNQNRHKMSLQFPDAWGEYIAGIWTLKIERIGHASHHFPACESHICRLTGISLYIIMWWLV